MFPLLLALLQSASAEDLRQELVWHLSIDGTHVGERRLTLKYVPTAHGNRRILEAHTAIDGRIGPAALRFEERMTAHAGRDPASFTAVQETNGKRREVQAQRTALGWRLSIAEGGKSRTWELQAGKVDLSTVDLLDPESRVPLSAYTEAKVLSAESGGVWNGRITRLGPEELVVGGASVFVEGLELRTEDGISRYWYTADGYLVKFEARLAGHDVVALLADPPPAGPDSQPIDATGSGIREVDL